MIWKGFGFIAPDEPGPDAYLSRFALDAAQIQGVKVRGFTPDQIFEAAKEQLHLVRELIKGGSR